MLKETVENIEENQKSNQPLVQQPDPDVEKSKEERKEKSKLFNYLKILIYIFVSVFLVSLGAVGFSSFQQKSASKPQSSPMPTIIPVASSTPTSEPAVPDDWKILTFEDFSIKYPNSWINLGKEGGCGPAIRPPETKDYWITICLFGEQDPQVEATRVSNLEFMSVLSLQKKIVIDGVLGVIQSLNDTSSGLFQTEVYLKNKRGLHTIYGFARSKTLLEEYQATFDQILSTFKFLDEEESKEDNLSKALPTRVISYIKTAGWLDFQSLTGYSLQQPSGFYDTSRLGERYNIYGKNECSLIFGNDAGGVLSVHVVPYGGGSRRELFNFHQGLPEANYNYRYEDIFIQDKKSLIIEIGLSSEMIGTGVVIPVDNSALIILWDHRDKDDPNFIKLLESIKINSTLNPVNCGK